MPTPRAVIQGVVFLLVLDMSAGCADDLFGKACTLIGCATDGVVIDLGREDLLGPGTFAIVAGDGNVDRSCTLTMPGATLAGCMRAFTTDGHLKVHYLDFAPESLTVTVTRDGQAWASVADTRMTYTESRPNGPDCPPVCRHAEVVVTPVP